MINKLIGGVAVLALVIGGVALVKNTQVIEKTFQAGAVSSPDIISPYISYGGVRQWAYSMEIRQATSTLCSFLSPSSTSTLEHLSAKFDTTASYATSYAWGNDPTAFSTTTIIVAPYGAAAGGKLEIIASTTKVTAFTQNGVVSPNTYINLKLSTSTAGASATFAPVGTCKVMFREL